MLNELEKHWMSILDTNICIPTHEILEGNEDEKVSYRKTTFLSDKILNNTSPTTQILRKSQIVTENFVEEDLTDFVLETVGILLDVVVLPATMICHLVVVQVIPIIMI